MQPIYNEQKYMKAIQDDIFAATAERYRPPAYPKAP